jgi:pyrimidine-nucleoside phosphorylase
MDMLEIILAKRYGQELSKKQIAFFVDGVTRKSIPDYQISSLLMAIVLTGMTDKEMTELTMQMAHSGEICDLSRIPGTKVDKHSSGGVGDKCTMIVLPMVAACGVPVVKLSGRGLGFTGGTIDKLESIRGFQTAIPITQFVEQIQKAGMVVSGQTPELAPADKILYALRDVTGTVDSIPLIASSIMSKKIAGGADAIVLNVTCGSGAFMKDEASARALSLAMIQIGHIAGRPVTCVISSMDQPLGRAVGNTLEVMEAFDVLCGKGSPDVIEVCTTLAAAMLQRSDAGKTLSYLEAYSKVGEVLEDGTAIDVFSRFVTAQGGSVDIDGRPICIDMPQVCSSVYAQEQGYISHVDARSIGEASMLLGAGRRTKDDVIDPGAGITLEKKIGSYVEIGDKIADLYLGQSAISRTDAIREAKELVSSSVSISPEPVLEPVEIIAILDEKSL